MSVMTPPSFYTCNKPGHPSTKAVQLWLSRGRRLAGDQSLHRWPSEQERLFTRPY